MNWDLRVPYAYGTQLVSLRWLNTWLLEHHHPEYVRRLVAFIHSRNGTMGVGGGWRAGGAQPDRPGFAPEGRSFHQDQEFADGFTGAAAVDLVVAVPWSIHRAPYWSEVPAQGSAARLAFGVHCNVAGEPWHMQWCDAHLPGGYDLDGWQSWWDAGRPGPRPGYPLPAEHDPTHTARPPIETTPPEDDDMHAPLGRFTDTADVFLMLRASQDTFDSWGLDPDDAVELPKLTAAQRQAFEAQYGRKLTPLA